MIINNLPLNNFPKRKYYFFLIIDKFFAIFECNNYRLHMLVSEFFFSFPRRLNPLRFFPINPKEITIETKQGKFRIHKTIIDFCICSPSFERTDINELIRQINSSIQAGTNIIFIDIGSNIGKYTVSIGNHFKKLQNRIKILSFEPEMRSFELLKKNIHLNGLRNVLAFNIALSNNISKKYFFVEEFQNMLTTFDIYSKNKVLVQTNKLNNFIRFIPKKYTEVYIKMDVEGHEWNVLNGSKTLLNRFKKVTLLIEDTIPSSSNKLLKYLNSNFQFLNKKSPYNSFWVK